MRKKYTLLIILLVSIIFQSYAQDDGWRCGTPNPTPEQQIEFAQQLEKLKSSRVAIDIGEMTYVPIQAHVVTRNDGTGGIPLADINSMIAWLNKYYRGSDLEFYLADQPNIIKNSSYYDFIGSQENGLASGNDNPNAANAYFVNSIDGGGDCHGVMGYAYFPGNSVKQTRILMRNCGVAIGTTMIHEIGHFFSLPHTFNKTGHGSNGQHSPYNIDAEDVNGGNCMIAGDKICDTPADPGANFNVPNWTQGSCIYTGNARDRNNERYKPHVRNIMSYYSGCQTEFTPQQYAKMKEGLAIRKSHTTYNFLDPFDNVRIPTNIGGLAVNGVVQVKWNDIENGTGSNSDGVPYENETGYLIERSDSPTEGFLCLGGAGVGPNVEEYTDHTAEKGKTYYYRVKSSNGNAAEYTDVIEVEVIDKCLPYFSTNCDGGSLRGFSLARNDNKNKMIDNLSSGCQSYRRDANTRYNYQNFKGIVELAYLGIGLDYDYNLLKSDKLTYTTIWIDGNQNGTFEADEKVLDNATTSTGTFTIPTPEKEGITMMRVLTSNDMINGPCDGYNSGEAEDYEVKVTSSGLPCAITLIEAVEGSQTVCVEKTNYYTQDVKIHYTDNPIEGKLVVNGQEFDITTSPQTVTLVDLPATGVAIDVNAYFSKDILFCNAIFENVFTAADRCSTCEISAVTVESKETLIEECDPDDNSYSKEITIVYADEKEITGKVVVNGISFDIEPSPMTVTLENLDSDGQEVDVEVYFEEKPGCAWFGKGLFVAPESCLACRIWDITLDEEGVISACDPATNTFYADIVIDHQKAPESGQLVVNGQKFDIEESPQKVRVVDLESNGQAIPFEAYFESEEDCRKSVALGKAPENCEPCDIISLEDGGIVEECTPGTNTYKQKLILKHKKAPLGGNILIEVSGIATPFTFPVTNTGYEDDFTVTQELVVEIPANTVTHDITVTFENESICTKVFEGVFTSPEECNPCRITAVEATVQSACDPETNTYSQTVKVAFEYPPKEGGLLIVNGVAKTINNEVSPIFFTLNNLVSDGQPVAVDVKFDKDGTDGPCTFYEEALFVAPENCEPCKIKEILLTNVSACNPATNTYSLSFDLEHYKAPESGTLIVRGKGFDREIEIGESPQSIIIDNIPANGESTGISVFFSEDLDCIVQQDDFATAPAGCNICDIVAVELGEQSACNILTNKYSQEIKVTHRFGPSTGYLNVNGQQFFIEKSPQIVVLRNLEANGGSVGINVAFSEEETCSFEEDDFFTAPADCNPCVITDIKKLEQGTCDPETNTYTQKVEITYANSSEGEKLVVNGQEFDMTTSPQVVELVDLVSDAQNVHVEASITNSDCKLMKENVFTAPVNCQLCDISNITFVKIGECKEATSTFDQEVFVYYHNAPTTGKLIVNEQEFDITGSPQKVLLKDLTANGNNVTLKASFAINDDCSFEIEDAFKAPASCAVCLIAKVEVGTTGLCNPETNTYDQELFITYNDNPVEGKLVVNGQEFNITGSPQRVILENLVSDGNEVTVEANFSEKSTCKLVEGKFTAPIACNPCGLTAINLVETGTCDSETNLFDLKLSIVYENAPTYGKLIVNEQEFEIATSPQEVLLTGLVSDGEAFDVNAYFSAEPMCAFTFEGITTAPEKCEKCAVIIVESVATGECNPETNTFDQTLRVTYQNAPETGKLIVNEQEFDITGSPQEVVLTDLNSDGLYHNVKVSFTANERCVYEKENLYKAPHNCEPCAITNIALGEQKACNPLTGFFEQKIIVTYAHQPKDAKLIVNGQEFDIAESPQEVSLTGLVANGNAIDVKASFDSEESCEKTMLGLITAPESCLPCKITSLKKVEIGACVGVSNTYEAIFHIEYSNAPKTGKLVIEGLSFQSEVDVADLDREAALQEFVIDGLKADGEKVDVMAYFTADDSDCMKIAKELFRAPEACENCIISKVILGDQVHEITSSTFDQTIFVHYNNEPTTGKILVNGNEFDITGSPQRVVLTNLNADGSTIDLNVLFTDNNECSIEMEEFIDAPMQKLDCFIGEVNAKEQSICDSENNTYTQTLEITFENQPEASSLIVNGQTFDLVESPAVIVLTDLRADGNQVNVFVQFEGTECKKSFENVFKAPKDCNPCDITNITIGKDDEENDKIGTCFNGEYSQEVIVTYTNAPKEGKLIVNEQEFDITGSPQKLILSNLEANGQAVSIKAVFSNNDACELLVNNIYTAPICEEIACDLNSLRILEQTACDFQTNTYSQAIELTYEHEKNTGEFVINGKEYSITESPQIIKLTNLISDGSSVDLDISIKGEACELQRLNAFKAPEACDRCEILAIDAASSATCNIGTRTYDKSIIITYRNAPLKGKLIVNEQQFDITKSPQTVVLRKLPASITGEFVDIVVSFSETPCELTLEEAFSAPSCDATDCLITAEVLTQTACDPSSFTYSQEIEITYENNPALGYIVVNEQSFEITGSPQKIVLDKLHANGKTVDLAISFSDIPNDCDFLAKDAFQAPEPCKSIDESSVLQIFVGKTYGFERSEPNKFYQEIKVIFDESVKGKEVMINGHKFKITKTEEIFMLATYGEPEQKFDITAYVIEEEDRIYNMLEAYSAPKKGEFVTGINNELGSYKIYPVPAKDYLTIESNRNERLELIVSNISQQEVIRKHVTLQNNRYQLDISSLPQGMYILQLIAADNQQEVLKFIVK